MGVLWKSDTKLLLRLQKHYIHCEFKTNGIYVKSILYLYLFYETQKFFTKETNISLHTTFCESVLLPKWWSASNIFELETCLYVTPVLGFFTSGICADSCELIVQCWVHSHLLQWFASIAHNHGVIHTAQTCAVNKTLNWGSRKSVETEFLCIKYGKNLK